MTTRIVVILLLLSGCGIENVHFQWGTVITLRADSGRMGCLYKLPRAAVQLDDGRVIGKCLDVPIGTRVQICPTDNGCLRGTIKADPGIDLQQQRTNDVD